MSKNKMLSIEEVEKKLIIYRIKKEQIKLQATTDIGEKFQIIGKMQKLCSILEEIELKETQKQTAWLWL